MANNYIGIDGLVTQSLEEITADLTELFRSCYGTDINIEQNSPDGQFIRLLAQEKKDTLDLVTQIYNCLDVDAVVGIPQDILYKLNALTRKNYTYSYCYVYVTTTGAVTLQGLDDNITNAEGTGYTVTDANGNRWILTETQTITESGQYLLNFRAADLGNVTALANTINQMETVIRGVSGVNNPANNYITGNTGESDSAYRKRRLRSLAAPAQGFDESTEAQILELSDVIDCKVYDNRTNEVVNDIPAHGLWVIVEGGTAQEIGEVIYNNLPPGIPMKGSQTVTVEKLNGDIETISYDIAQPVNLYVKATITNFSTSDLDTDYIKQELAKNVYNIGAQVESVNLQTQIKNLIGTAGTPYDVTISADNSTWVEYVTPTELDGYFVISADNITLDVVN